MTDQTLEGKTKMKTDTNAKEKVKNKDYLTKAEERDHSLGQSPISASGRSLVSSKVENSIEARLMSLQHL